MDGRTCLRWLALGCVLAAAVGCNHKSAQPPFGQMPDGAGIQLPNTQPQARSMWGGSKPPPHVPVDVAEPVSNKPASADAIVAFANVQVDAAFDPKTLPNSKDELLDRARAGYQKALKQEPKNKAALLGMAQFYARVDEREKALEAYKKYLTLYPDDAAVAHEVAVVHARWKDWDGACAWCRFALKVDPENRNVKKTLGFCLARAGKWDDALATLCQVMPEAAARHNLAGLLDHLGQTDASKKQLQLAVQVDPSYEAAREFLAELDQPRAAPNALQQVGDQQPVP